MRRAGLIAVVVGGIGLAACAAPASEEPSPSVSGLRLTSSAFEHGGTIPPEHTCDGEDVSPPLAWDGVPDGTAAFVLLVTDHDAGDFVHWILTDIPADLRELPAGGEAGMPARNDFGGSGWGGPCPPSGSSHHYEFRLLALSEPIGVESTASIREVLETIDGNLVDETTLIGTYQRP